MKAKRETLVIVNHLCFIVPNNLKEMLKNSPLGNKLNLESKMTIREKQRAKRKAQE